MNTPNNNKQNSKNHPITAITHSGTGPNKDFTRNASPNTNNQSPLTNLKSQLNNTKINNQDYTSNNNINQNTFRQQNNINNNSKFIPSSFRNNLDPKYLSYGQQNITSLLNQHQFKPESMGANLIKQGNYQENMPLKNILTSAENSFQNRLNTQQREFDSTQNPLTNITNRIGTTVQEKLLQEKQRINSKLNIPENNLIGKQNIQQCLMNNLNSIKFESVESNKGLMIDQIGQANFQSNPRNMEMKQICVNHPQKKGKYYFITSEGKKLYFCSKCSIESASKGFKIFDATNQQVIEANSLLGLNDESSNLEPHSYPQKQQIQINFENNQPNYYSQYNKPQQQDSKLINSHSDINQKSSLDKTSGRNSPFNNDYSENSNPKEFIQLLVSQEECQQRSREMDNFSLKLLQLKIQATQLFEETKSKQQQLENDKNSNQLKINKLFEFIRTTMLSLKKSISDQISQQDEIEALQDIIDVTKSSLELCQEFSNDIEINKKSILNSIETAPYKKIFSNYHVKVDEQKKLLESFANFQISKISTNFDEHHIIGQLNQLIQGNIQIQNSSKPVQTTAQSPVPICKIPGGNKVVVSFQNKEMFSNISKIHQNLQDHGVCSPSGMINPLSSTQIQESLGEYNYGEQEKSGFQKVLFSECGNLQDMKMQQLNMLEY